MNAKSRGLIAMLALLSASAISAQEQAPVDALLQRGEELYHTPVGGCLACHGPTAGGLVGPTLHFGPSPANIVDQFATNPAMAVVTVNLKPTDEDLVAISMYIRSLAGLPLDPALPEQWRSELVAMQRDGGSTVEFRKTAFDRAVERVDNYAAVTTGWERRAKTGNIRSDYPSRVVARFDPGEPKFTPQPGKTYWYENVGTTMSPAVLFSGFVPPTQNQLVVGDATTRQIIASHAIDERLRSVVHTSAMSPDGRYAYMVGPREPSPDGNPNPAGSRTMLKLDALTLQPVAQITIGGQLHHGQIFRDKMLFDVFARDPDGLSFFVFDPATDKVIGGVKDADLGGNAYTVWTDSDYEKIYALVEPVGYIEGTNFGGGFRAVNQLFSGQLRALRPFWLAVINPDTWEVEKEIPLPGYRGSWVIVDSKKEHVYVVHNSANAAKIRLSDGAIVWASGTGIGPYGASLTADESELWIADKGEGAGQLGRTITIIGTQQGRITHTLYGGYKVDHVVLAPNGKEMWATSNGEGRIYVYDVKSKELLKVIDMPNNGDAHGLVWVHYDASGNPRVVRDQGNFHNGVNPMLGRPLDY